MNCPTPNEGTVDRVVRVVLAVLSLLAGIYWLSGWAQLVAYVLAIILAFTAATGFCALYKLFKWDTRKKK